MKRSRLDGTREIVTFFALCLFAWVIWIPQAAHRAGLPGWAPSFQSPLNVLTVWSPGLAAMLLTGLSIGKPGISALFRSLGSWRVPRWWWLLAVLFEPLKWLAAFLIDRLTGQTYPLGSAPLLKTLGALAPVMAPLALVFTLPNALGEELGWRAFALPRLQRRHGPLLASVILGLFWGCWHLPMWLAWRSGGVNWLSIGLMTLNMVPVAIMFTWLFNGTGGSLLPACVYHASMATKGYLLPKLPTLTEVILLWLFCAFVVIRGGLRRPGGEEASPPAEAPAAPSLLL